MANSNKKMSQKAERFIGGAPFPKNIFCFKVYNDDGIHGPQESHSLLSHSTAHEVRDLLSRTNNNDKCSIDYFNPYSGRWQSLSASEFIEWYNKGETIAVPLEKSRLLDYLNQYIPKWQDIYQETYKDKEKA